VGAVLEVFGERRGELRRVDDLKLRIGWKIRNAIYLAMMA
jgi:hypothetical protein